ncbi:MAG: helix-turn-helix transcriptional regulator [Lachnospiraceae bacterium]|nr:helix-turn-helix transcriptional regulator [Lachnospiraceae bacterium]
MSISDNIFRIMRERHITQKEFAKLISVPESTISDWKRKGKTPGADKIMDICKVLDTNPYDILLEQSEQTDYIVVDSKSDLGHLVLDYNSLSTRRKDRLKGYIEGLKG